MHVHSNSDIEHYAIMHTKKIKQQKEHETETNKCKNKYMKSAEGNNIKISIRILLGVQYKK